MRFHESCKIMAFYLVALLTHWLGAPTAYAQYFGQNKVGYRSFDFQTLTSPNLLLYHYTSDTTARKWLIHAEEWYKLHQSTLQDTISNKNPLILYNNHADFQQTTLFNSNIDPSTGGVTESIRKRIVIPHTHINRSTSHVIGHEMVHAFQYNLFHKQDTSSDKKSLQNIPLWIVEGMAEFMSIGRHDANTAMWIRDAILEDDFPSLEALNTPQYFPYRYGHAFWAYIAGLWGDKIVRKLYISIISNGLSQGLRLTLGYDMPTLSEMWKSHTEKSYRPFLQTKVPIAGEIVYEDVLSSAIVPSVSPDGRFLAFFTQSDPISGFELVIMDVINKKIVRKVKSLNRSSHIDFISPLESSVSWSPDSKKLATIVFSKGRSNIAIINVKNGEISKQIKLPQIGSLMYPSFSPDGNKIALSGMRDGQSDIYLLTLADNSIEPLTQDTHSDIQPSWSTDGRELIFATNRPYPSKKIEKGLFRLAIIDVATKNIHVTHFFPGADNLNPHFTADGNILFLSDRNGFRDLYMHDTRIKQTYLMTNLATGISGITPYSQAISLSHIYSTIYYCLYTKRRHIIARAELKDLEYIAVDHDKIDKTAGTLPPIVPIKTDSVTEKIHHLYTSTQPSVPADSIQKVPFKSYFQLDNISSTGIGVGLSNSLGSNINGGIALLFSDMLGYNNIYTVLSVNGEIYDIGAGVQYLNKKHFIDWGITLSHFPYLASFRSYSDQSISIDGKSYPARIWYTDIRRTFEENIAFTARLPISSHQRLEGVAGAIYLSYRIDRYSDTYVDDGISFQFVDRHRSRKVAPNPFFQTVLGGAWVGDNTKFGIVGPLDGYRYRISTDMIGGDIFYGNVTIDTRFYRWWNPVGLALRIYHRGRYGKNGESDRLWPLNVASPLLVHGFNPYTVYRNISTNLINNSSQGSFFANDYIGSKILVANIEVRIPFTGPKRLALIPSTFLFSELSFFADGGLAFASASYKEHLFGTSMTTQRPIYSLGTSLRINLFGFYILEPYFALPLTHQQENLGFTYGLNFFPAW